MKPERDLALRNVAIGVSPVALGVRDATGVIVSATARASVPAWRELRWWLRYYVPWNVQGLMPGRSGSFPGRRPELEQL